MAARQQGSIINHHQISLKGEWKMTTAVQTQTGTKMQAGGQVPWWLTLINGILAVIIGAIMLWGGLANKVEFYLILVTALGIYWMIDGVFKIIYIFLDHTMWGWRLFIGLIGIAAGVYIVSYPIIAALSLPKIFTLVLGIWGLMYGIILLISAFAGGGWAAGILGGLGILFGIALMVNYAAPGMGLAMIWSAAVIAFIGGIVLIVQAFRQKAA
jgi:uncharacterized membrane protein HdeD (DUF308 family)